MNALNKMMRPLLGIIMLDQTCLTLTFPLITLIFFETNSRLFTPETTSADRSMWYGFCISMPYLINIFFTPILSMLSDTIGRKKILLIEIGSACLFALLVGYGVYAGMLSLVIAGLAIKGAFARTNPTALAMMGDIAPKEKKILYMGYLQFMISIGAMIGPILGGYLAGHFFSASFNYAFAFFIAALLAACNTLLTAYLIPETFPAYRKRQAKLLDWAAMQTLIKDKNVQYISLLLLMIQISWSAYYQFIPPILKTIYAFNANQLGWFIGMIAFWLAFATSVVIPLLHRFFNAKQLIAISLYLMIAGFILTLIAFVPSSKLNFLSWIGAMPIAIGDVVAYSCLTALYSNNVASFNQGKVMGLSFIIIALVWAFTGILGGWLMHVATLLPLILAPIALLATLGLIHPTLRKKWTFSYDLI